MASSPRIEGLDEAIQQKIVPIWLVLCAYFSRWLRTSPRWNDKLLDPKRPRRLAALYCRLEITITQRDSRDLHKIRNGLAYWNNKYLRRLARSLGVFGKAEEQTLAYCRRLGHFDRPAGKLRHRLYQRARHNLPLIRPGLTEIAPLVQAVLREVIGVQERAIAFLERDLCRNAETAQAVAQALDRTDSKSLVNRSAVRITKRIIASYLLYGAPGLLVAIGYPLTNEMLRLQRQWSYIRNATSSPELALQSLRTDLAALYEVLSTIEPAQTWWLTDLLYAPLRSSIREQYIKQVTPAFRIEVTLRLGERRQCTLAEAIQLFELYAVTGMAGLIDWRCGILIEQIAPAFTWQRILDVATHRIQGLRPHDFEIVLIRLRHLYDAIVESGIPLATYRIVNERVGSAYRRRLRRRLRFGEAATTQRQQLKRRSRSILPSMRRRAIRALRLQGTMPQLVEQLIASFARRAEIHIRDAAALFREFETYGAIGLLEKAKWRDCIDSQTRSYLLRFRYGQLDRQLRWSVILQHVNAYCEAYNKPLIASHLARVIFNSAPKSRIWHGGVGEAVIRVRQRPALGLSKREWLHRVWRLILVTVKTGITDAIGRHAYRIDYILLVVDLASECPLACWHSTHQPGSVEVGLCLYQAIWRPGTLDWPLRGIPLVVQIPETLAMRGLEDINRAADDLAIQRVQTVDDDVAKLLRKRRRLAELVRAIPQGLQDIVRRPGVQDVHEERKRVQDGVLNWVYAHSFATHRTIAVPKEFRRHGVALAGHDSPGAGWLLPVDEEVVTGRRGVIYHDGLYTNPSIAIEPGHILKRRAFPYQYAGMGIGFFVQDGTLLHYVTWTGENV